jgi:predicted small lipoprotein YifL
MNARRLVTLALVLVALGGCGRRGPKPAEPPRAATPARNAPVPPVADSVTVGLWRFDERAGNHVPDASPFRLYGTAGPDVRSEFGRYRGVRGFTATANSFVHVPYNPVLESPRGFTVEAWVYLNDLSRYELSTIATRWTPVPNSQSWLLGVVGRKLTAATTVSPSPGWFTPEVALVGTGRLVFLFRPDLAAGTQSFGSTVTLPLQRWVHVAASVDGEVVRLYVNGKLDSQAAVPNGIRRSDAPLVVGNVIDPRRLTDFGGDLRIDPGQSPLPFYALNGLVDELRLSNVARRTFESADLR